MGGLLHLKFLQSESDEAASTMGRTNFESNSFNQVQSQMCYPLGHLFSAVRMYLRTELVTFLSPQHVLRA